MSPKTKIYENSFIAVFSDGTIGVSDGVGFVDDLRSDEVNELYDALQSLKEGDRRGNETLDGLREQRESGLDEEQFVRLEHYGYPTILVVVSKEAGDGSVRYRLHRYFRVGPNNWQVSVDVDWVRDQAGLDELAHVLWDRVEQEIIASFESMEMPLPVLTPDFGRVTCPDCGIEWTAPNIDGKEQSCPDCGQTYQISLE